MALTGVTLMKLTVRFVYIRPWVCVSFRGFFCFRLTFLDFLNCDNCFLLIRIVRIITHEMRSVSEIEIIGKFQFFRLGKIK